MLRVRSPFIAKRRLTEQSVHAGTWWAVLLETNW